MKSCYQPFHFNIESRYSSSSIDISQNGVIPHQINRKAHTQKSSFRGASIVLECPHCKNTLESTVSGVLCQICGARISWIIDLESRLKNLNNLTLFRLKKNQRGKRERNDRKINYRKIDQQKEKKREFFQKKLQDQARLESQEELLLLNQDYFRRKTYQLSHEQYIPVRMIESEEKKNTPRKITFFGLESFILLIMVIITLILGTI